MTGHQNTTKKKDPRVIQFFVLLDWKEEKKNKRKKDKMEA
jgi:hypothetical protein